MEKSRGAGGVVQTQRPSRIMGRREKRLIPAFEGGGREVPLSRRKRREFPKWLISRAKRWELGKRGLGGLSPTPQRVDYGVDSDGSQTELEQRDGAYCRYRPSKPGRGA